MLRTDPEKSAIQPAPLTVDEDRPDKDQRNSLQPSVELSKHARALSAAADIDRLVQRGEQYKLQFPGVDEAKMMRKVDMRVIPVLCIMYLLAYLDRVNIGNAVLFGLKEDLKLEGTQYNSALLAFFIPYMFFDIPFNALVKRLRPHVWLSLSMFLFGLLSLCQGLTQNFAGLVATRFFLGLVESGVFPACLYLISMWYRRAEAQKRYSFFFSSTTLGGAFGGLLASAIGKMDGVAGYRGWRWIFIIEGALTCAAAVIIYFFISDFPEEARWLTPDEREFVKARLHEDVGDSYRDEPLTWRAVVAALRDIKIIIGGFMYLGLVCAGYSYAYFSPAIIQSLGHSSIRAQLISVPPWACAFVVAMVVAAISDYMRHRFLFAVAFTALALAGYIMLLVVHDNPNLQYAALFLPAMGTYTAMPIAICWFGINLGGHHRRAVGTAWQIGFGSIGGIIAVYSFLAKDAPRYIAGYSVCIAATCTSIVADCAYYYAISRENRRRSLEDSSGDSSSATLQDEKGDLRREYRYLL